MLLSRSVFRRYTPPTCTLQLTAKTSPLSRWSGGQVLQDFRFELSFDDPRLPEEKQVTIEGDRAELNILCDVVAEYIHSFLQQPASSFSLQYTPSLELPSSTSALPESPVFEQVNQRNFPPSSPSSPDLKPKGLLNHELFFGSLATASSGEFMTLSTTQLWDLANALDEYSAEITAFPTFSRSSGVEPSTIWAAAVFLVATGLTAAGMRWYQLNQEAATIASQQEEVQQFRDLNQSPEISLVPLPPNSGTPSPELSPTLSSQEKLPPPPEVNAPQGPVRTQSQPLTVPSQTSLPSPPAPKPLPQRQTVTVVPQPSQPPAPARADIPNPNDIEALSPGFSSENEGGFNLPQLPPLQSQPSNPNQFSPPVESATARSPQQSTSNTLLDTIPQVTEARQYFQQRWQPPEGISQTLEYRLVLSQDGSLQRIIPLGQASKIYLDRTGMPLLGESFVSPVEVSGNPQIRLMLGPDGTVKTFLE